MSISDLQFPDTERYLQRGTDKVFVWNHHHKGFFVRPHETPSALIVCVQPADRMRAEFSLDSEFRPQIPILEELLGFLPEQTLRELYGANPTGEIAGIGYCQTGLNEPVLAIRTVVEKNVPKLFDVATEAIEAYWADKMTPAYMRD